MLGRRPRLTVDAVVATAVVVADTDGPAALSMNRVAAALGVGTMTLYTYVPSKAELLDLMVDDVLAGLAPPGPGPWREQVEVHVERTRAMYRGHPLLPDVSTVRPPVGPWDARGAGARPVDPRRGRPATGWDERRRTGDHGGRHRDGRVGGGP